MIRCASGSRSPGSLEGVVRGLLFIIHSTSAIRVRNDLSSRLRPCSHIKAVRIERTECICHSQTPPICDADGGFCFHCTQSALNSVHKPLWIALLSISDNALCNSFSAPVIFVP